MENLRGVVLDESGPVASASPVQILLDFAAPTFRDFGAKILHLEVNRGNPAIKLYPRCGLEDHDRYLLSKRLVGSHRETS